MKRVYLTNITKEHRHLWYEVKNLVDEKKVKTVYLITSHPFDHVEHEIYKGIEMTNIEKDAYVVAFCDNYGILRYELELPVIHDYKQLIIHCEDGTCVIGRYGTTEAGYELDEPRLQDESLDEFISHLKV